MFGLTVPLMHSRITNSNAVTAPHFSVLSSVQVQIVTEIPFQSIEVTSDLEAFLYFPAPAAEAGVKTITAV